MRKLLILERPKIDCGLAVFDLFAVIIAKMPVLGFQHEHCSKELTVRKAAIYMASMTSAILKTGWIASVKVSLGDAAVQRLKSTRETAKEPRVGPKAKGKDSLLFSGLELSPSAKHLSSWPAIWGEMPLTPQLQGDFPPKVALFRCSFPSSRVPIRFYSCYTKCNTRRVAHGVFAISDIHPQRPG